MDKLSTRLSIIILAFTIGIASVWGWLYYLDSQQTRIILPAARWERIYFREIDEATNLGGLEELRKTTLKRDDIEIRVWRGFGLEPLEGVILERKDDKWTAAYIKITRNPPSYIRELGEFIELSPPKSGWESFWKQISDKGIMTLPDPTDEGCTDGSIDGTSYVVEINHNKIYRTYKYDEGNNGCGADGKRMDEIGEIIGLEFDAGAEKCTRAQWFACMTYLREKNQNNR